MLFSKHKIILLSLGGVLLSIIGVTTGLSLYSAQQPIGQYVDMSYKKMDIAELTKESAIVLSGKVIGSSVKKETTPDGPTIYTYYKIQPETVYKGTTTNPITVRQLGGSVDNFTTSVVDGAVLENDKSYLLFLKSETIELYSILAGPQGKYTLVNGSVLEQEQARMIINQTQGLITLDDIVQRIK